MRKHFISNYLTMRYKYNYGAAKEVCVIYSIIVLFFLFRNQTFMFAIVIAGSKINPFFKKPHLSTAVLVLFKLSPISFLYFFFKYTYCLFVLATHFFNIF